MSRGRWKMVWSALRGVPYWRAADYYGKEDVARAYLCLLDARKDVFPYVPLEHRLAAFKAGWRPSDNHGFPKSKLPLP